MKKVSIIMFLSVLTVLRVFSQDMISILKNYDNSIEEKIKCDFKLLLISNSGCGHCLMALEKIKVLQDEISIIIIDYGEDEEFEKLKEKYSYIFLQGKHIEKLGFQDFYPKLFLYNGNDELIWKREGWFDKNIEKISSRI